MRCQYIKLRFQEENQSHKKQQSGNGEDITLVSVLRH